MSTVDITQRVSPGHRDVSSSGGEFGLKRPVLPSAGAVSADAALLQRIVQAWPYGAGGTEKCPQYGRAVLGTPGQGELGQLGPRAYLADPDVGAGRRPGAGRAQPRG